MTRAAALGRALKKGSKNSNIALHQNGGRPMANGPKASGGKPVRTPVAPAPHSINGKGPNANKGKGGAKAGPKGGAKHPAAPHTPTAEDYANQDPDYRRAVAAYRANLANVRSQTNANKNDLTADYTTTRSRLLENFAQNNKQQQSDFAARGLFGSGVYAKANADRQTGETQQLNDASTSYQRNTRQLNTDLANATNLEAQQESTAKAAAIRRAAAQYGITGRPAATKPKRKKL